MPPGGRRRIMVAKSGNIEPRTKFGDASFNGQGDHGMTEEVHTPWLRLRAGPATARGSDPWTVEIPSRGISNLKNARWVAETAEITPEPARQGTLSPV